MHVISVELQSLPVDVMSRFLVPPSMDSCLFVSIYVFLFFSFSTSIFFTRQAFGDALLRSLLWPFSPRPDQTKKKQSGASESIWLCSDRAGVCDGGTASKQRDLEESLRPCREDSPGFVTPGFMKSHLTSTRRLVMMKWT
jgi:hypothetical protein